MTSSISFLIGLAATTLGVAGLCYFALDTSAVRQRVRQRVGLLPTERDRTDIDPLEPAKTVPVGNLNRVQAELARRLHFLGLSPRWTPSVFRACQLLGAICSAAVITGVGQRLFGLNSVGFLMALVLLGTAIGYRLPNILIDRLLREHRRRVVAGMPEAIELLVVAVEAGLSLEEAVTRICAELRQSQPEMAEELALTSADLSILPDRDEALRRLVERVDVPSMHSLVTTLSQTLRYGTPLAQALRVVATELRNDGLMRLEERVNRLPVLLTIPMILFILPSLFLIIMGPAALRTLDVLAR